MKTKKNTFFKKRTGEILDSKAKWPKSEPERTEKRNGEVVENTLVLKKRTENEPQNEPSHVVEKKDSHKTAKSILLLNTVANVLRQAPCMLKLLMALPLGGLTKVAQTAGVALFGICPVRTAELEGGGPRYLNNALTQRRRGAKQARKCGSLGVLT